MKIVKELRIVLVSIILIIFTINLSSAWTNSTLYHYNPTFTQLNLLNYNNENITWWESDPCTIQKANRSDCGYINGSYLYKEGFNNSIYDNNWNTYTNFSSGTNELQFLYRLPKGTYNLSWIVKDSGGNRTNPYGLSTMQTYWTNEHVASFDIYKISISPYVYYYFGGSPTAIQISGVDKIYEEELRINRTAKGSEYTRILKVPQNTYLTNARMNLSGYNISSNIVDYKIQSNICTIAGSTCSETDKSEVNDGDFSTYWEPYSKFDEPLIKNYTGLGIVSSANVTIKVRSYDGGNISLFYLNYTSNNWKLLGYVSCTGVGCTNLTTITKVIPQDGLNQTISIKINNTETANSRFYESELNYTSTPYPSNLEISAGEFLAYQNLSSYTTGNVLTPNLASSINNYLSSCTYSGGYCNVPIKFYSSSEGNLQYSALEFNNYGFMQNSLSYPNQSYETENERFELNVSYDSSFYTTTSAKLIYNGTSYDATKSANGNNLSFYVDLDIPLTTGIAEQRSFFWNVSLTNSSGTTIFPTDSYSHLVTPIFFSFCNATYTQSYINFTFKDETYSTAISASTDLSTWSYYMGDGDVTKSLLFTNTTVNPSYAFCFSPGNQSVNVLLQYYQYSATGYPQRQYYLSGSLTNSTTNTVLYLLNSTQGVYTTFIANSPSANVVTGVTVQIYRSISGSNTLISQGVTDAAGSATFWLNPNYDHTVIFSKTGYTTQTLSLRPTQSTYTVIMGGGTQNATFEQYLAGINWNYAPHQQVLQPNTTYTFGFNITAEYEDIVDCKLELVNASNSILDSTTGCSASGGNLSLVYNTGSNNKIYLKFYIDVGEGLVVLDPVLFWIDATNISSIHTLKSFFETLSNYSQDFGESDARNTYTKIVAFFLVLTVIIGFISYSTGAELMNPGFAILIVYGAILFGSVAGFFTVDHFNVVTGTGFNAEWINKYFIAFITGMYTAGYFATRFRRETL